jgi:hypothetical protein
MTNHDDDAIGAYSLNEFCQLFSISPGLARKEQRAGRLIFSKIGDRTLITKQQARQYQRRLEAEARPGLTAS